MPTDIKIPSVGESISTGTIATWHVADGATVKLGDALLTLDTDKVSTELAAEAAGVLQILSPAGSEVAIGAVVGKILEAEGAPSAPQAKAEKKPVKSEPEKSAPAAVAAKPTPPPAPPDENSLSLLPKLEAPSIPDQSGRVTRKKMTPLRRKIAAHLVNAQHTAAILTTFNEVDMTETMNLRKQVQETFLARHGVKLGFMSFFIKAVVNALKAVPQVNARIDGDEIVEHHFYDVGVAVSTDRGLLVPVVRDCERKSFAEIEKDIIDYATKARDGKIQLEDLQGGVITITNCGIFGSLLSTPILNPPQSAILGLHAIKERPVAVNGKVEIRPMMYLALSYDHRLIDGKEAVTFLVRIKECIEAPSRLLLGI